MVAGNALDRRLPDRRILRLEKLRQLFRLFAAIDEGAQLRLLCLRILLLRQRRSYGRQRRRVVRSRDVSRATVTAPGFASHHRAR